MENKQQPISAQSTPMQLARQIARAFSLLPRVEAVALGGSHGKGPGAYDTISDIDLYIYTRGDIPIQDRQHIIRTSGGSVRANLALNYWGAGDEWFNTPAGIEVDCMYFARTWIQEQVTRVMKNHQPALGYTTCFCYTVSQSYVFYDPEGWFADLQAQCQAEYPEALRQNIIAHNYPVLRSIIPAYAVQIEKAVNRTDIVSINHRLAALLASYFDIIFALNRQLHPGEKRLVEFALNHCARLPVEMDKDLNAILLIARDEIAALPGRLGSLLDHLDQLLQSEGFTLHDLVSPPGSLS